jgi:polyhydroxybutyrate depolymerase
MISGGVERKFQLNLPKDYDGSESLPVVLSLHALTAPHFLAAIIAEFPDAATRHDFIGVAPSGLLDGTTPYWLAAPSDEEYDVEFISDLLDLLEAELCIDTSRVYSTGWSNGGQMSSLLACRLSDRITAVAPVAGVEFYESCEGDPVAVMAFHGTADPIVTYEGGGLNAMTIANMHYWKGNIPAGVPEHSGVDEAMVTWAAHNGCEAHPTEQQVSAQVRRRSWPGCDAETILYIVDGGGHGWPGKPFPFGQFGPNTTDIDATSLSYEFFFRQS